VARPLPQFLTRSLPERLHVGIFKDPASAWTHFLGLLAAVVATTVLVRRAGMDGPKAAGMMIYGGALIAVFLASSLYHFFDAGERGNRWLRRLDHSAIFLMIGGTAVPILLHLLGGNTRLATLGLVAAFAVGGSLLKVFWIESPEWLGLALYFGMSFVVLGSTVRMLPHLSSESFMLLVGGAAAYALGAVVYARRWPDPWPGAFGHHEVWHLFVLAGAGAHFAFTYTLLGFPYRPL
jgi:hemolysin III